MCRIFLCEPNVNIHIHKSLWKTLVDKVVENVENSRLSTVILVFSDSGASCGKVCIASCISVEKVSGTLCYVTVGGRRLCEKTRQKSLQFVKFRCHFLFPFEAHPKIFVKNRQRSFWVSSPPQWEYFSYPISTGGTPCREK